jgi:hypothetical protein
VYRTCDAFLSHRFRVLEVANEVCTLTGREGIRSEAAKGLLLDKGDAGRILWVEETAEESKEDKEEGWDGVVANIVARGAPLDVPHANEQSNGLADKERAGHRV